MNSQRFGFVTLATACTLALGACAGHPQHEPPPSMTVVATPQGGETQTVKHVATHPVSPSNKTVVAPESPIGVPACDQYLSTYKACHAAAGIFAPGQIDERYEQMRASLQRDAQDPAKRATLDQRCRTLAQLEHDALHGKSCDVNPVAPAKASSG